MRGVRWFDFGAEATGVIAIGQFATGVIAIGQVATGVVAVGQLARGGIVLGQLAFGVVSVGQLTAGLAWAAGMVGIGGRAGFGLVLPVFPRRASALPPDGGEVSAEWRPTRSRVAVWRIALFAALLVAYWFAVLTPLRDALFGLGGVLNPLR
jgi:hypothetical protein